MLAVFYAYLDKMRLLGNRIGMIYFNMVTSILDVTTRSPSFAGDVGGTLYLT